ncbi:hypothetical protein MNEG_8376 [Monoraphidium neglectum]|uniref:Uncharacterized protein n=1 Tax=Monoraphidium neglectum TaxID=145388 RepID=A0A0D2JJY4_9CHLO|nr:hypothetical protein MNEG_8376 [Monoraphidium neglectum]KIY99587.1 hypothetical protein MNEG_8376 [Monoraphidium neglectum]|eukprot:XP_013898607.1 hypothetical protein MNEG_8376 [Monoraphidium neglectum]
MLLGTLNRGVQQRCASVSLPLSKAGLELARTLKTLGVVSDVTVFQKLARLKGGHHRVWPPGVQPATSTDCAGYPAMYLRLALQWQRGAAAFAAPGGLSALTAPITFNAPTPETVKIISKPTAQRHVDLRQLISARRAAPPGVFLLSTPQGLVTDVEAELRGTGGILLAHLGLPLPHVLRVRGALRQKHLAEQAAAAAAAAEGRAAPPRVPLAAWDMAGHVAARVVPRLYGEEAERQAGALLDAVEEQSEGQADVVNQMKKQLQQLALEEAAWRAHGEQGGDGGGGDGRGGSSGSGWREVGGARGDRRLPPPRSDGGRRPRRY